MFYDSIFKRCFGFVACNNKGYGEKCSTPCGNCLGLAQCHHLNGTCTDGCNPGYQGSACNDGRNLVLLNTCELILPMYICSYINVMGKWDFKCYTLFYISKFFWLFFSFSFFFSFNNNTYC